MAIAYVDFVFTKSADSGAASSPHAHARSIAVGDQVSVFIASSGLNLVTVGTPTDDGANNYTKQGTTVSVDGIRGELWTTIATQVATSISIPFTPTPAGSTSLSVSSSRKTGVPLIGLVTSGSGSAAAASVTSPVTQDDNNWIEFWVVDDQSNGGAGWTNAPSTGNRRSGTATDAVNNVDHMMEDVDALVAGGGGSIAFSQTLNFNPGNYVIFALELRSTTGAPVITRSRKLATQQRMVA
jgi:hypothetical protein